MLKKNSSGTLYQRPLPAARARRAPSKGAAATPSDDAAGREAEVREPEQRAAPEHVVGEEEEAAVAQARRVDRRGERDRLAEPARQAADPPRARAPARARDTRGRSRARATRSRSCRAVEEREGHEVEAGAGLELRAERARRVAVVGLVQQPHDLGHAVAADDAVRVERVRGAGPARRARRSRRARRPRASAAPRRAGRRRRRAAAGIAWRGSLRTGSPAAPRAYSR